MTSAGQLGLAQGQRGPLDQDMLGRTALHHAAKASQPETLSLILEKGGSPGSGGCIPVRGVCGARRR